MTDLILSDRIEMAHKQFSCISKPSNLAGKERRKKVSIFCLFTHAVECCIEVLSRVTEYVHWSS